MTASKVTVKPVDATYAQIICDLGKRTFRDTYSASSTPQKDLEVCMNENYNYDIQRKELSDPAMHSFIAFDEHGTAIGFAQLRQRKDNYDFIGDKEAVELQRIYVDKEFTGKGVGKALLSAALEKAKELGKRTIWLGVWEHNFKAMAFYESFGFYKAGRHIFKVGDQQDLDFVYAKKL
ncbi:acyl-CoA N-acyltransferase [Mycotypha africana]|uniref:acyl-CoA N-acyltransferase n=1 Tax=Mycotypha africana TaxID=64632 RepID=UPI002300C6E6|nr:acyl-CoA N-acyltransferase [Mycotypha africana]KAI8991267.1 acyl-CoA N-acyltransferase [Mycotypha africana]